MRDFLRSELENRLIFGSQYVAHALFIINPFGHPTDIEYNLVRLLKTEDSSIEISNITVDTFKESYEESKNNNMSTFGKILLPKPDINFYGHVDHKRGRYNMYSLDGMYDYSVEYEWLDNGIAISSTVVETSDIDSGTECCTQTKTLTASDTIPLEKIDINNSILSILFIDKYNIPLVRVWNTSDLKSVMIFIDALEILEDKGHVLVDLNKALLHESKHIEIDYNPIEMKQESDLDNCIKFNYFDKMYGSKLDTEFIDISFENGEYITTKYENLVTKLKMLRNGSGIEYYIEGEIADNDEKYAISKTLIGTSSNQIKDIIELCNEIKASTELVEKGVHNNPKCYYIVTKEDPNASKYIVETDNHYDIEAKSIISKISILGNTGMYGDRSGIVYSYMYNNTSDTFIYNDSINSIMFSITDNDGINIIKVVNNNGISLSRVWIRDKYGVPVFLDVPIAAKS